MFKHPTNQAKDRTSLIKIISSFVQTLWMLKFNCQSHIGDYQLWSHRLLVICVDQSQSDGLFVHDLALTVTTLTPQTHLGNILIPPALKNPLGILASQGYSKTHLIERSGNIWSGLSLDPCHMLLKKINLNRGTSPATVIYEWSSFLV